MSLGRVKYRADTTEWDTYSNLGWLEWVEAHVAMLKAFPPEPHTGGAGDRWVNLKPLVPVTAYHDWNALTAPHVYAPLSAERRGQYITDLVTPDKAYGYDGQFLDDVNWQIAFRDNKQDKAAEEPEIKEQANLIEAIRLGIGTGILEINSQYHDIWPLLKAGNADVLRALNQVDLMTKEWGVGYNSAINTAADYAEFFEYVDTLHSMGIQVVLTGAGAEAITLDEFEYALATYFLFTNPATAPRHVFDGDFCNFTKQVPESPSSGVGVHKWWKGLDVHLEAPTSSRERDPLTGVWKRTFANGIVYVLEPGAAEHTVTLPPGAWLHADGSVAEGVAALKPRTVLGHSLGSGAVFMRPAEEVPEGGIVFPQPFFNGPDLISDYQQGTPAWERVGSSPDFKPYQHYNEWDDGTGGNPAHTEGRFSGSTEIETSYYLAGHTPKGTAYDAYKRKALPIQLTFPVVGYAPTGSFVLVDFFNPTPDALYEPDPEHNPGVTALGHLGTINIIGPPELAFKDSKGNQCSIVGTGHLGGIVRGLIIVGGGALAGGPLEPGDTITITFEPGPLAAPLQKVIPDDVGFPATKKVVERHIGGGEEKVAEEVGIVIPPGSGITTAYAWEGEWGPYPYGEHLNDLLSEPPPPNPWAGGSYIDPLEEPGPGVTDKPRPLPLFYKAVPQTVGIYCFASVFASFPLESALERHVEPQQVGVGTLSIPVSASPSKGEGNGAYLAGDWDASAKPEGGEYDGLLNATSHGNHMVVDYRPYGPFDTYEGEGTGDGWLDLTKVPGVSKPLNAVTGSPVTITHSEEPSERLGVGPKGGLGRVITVTATPTADWLADAGNMLSKRSTDNAALWWYFNWMNSGGGLFPPLVDSKAWQLGIAAVIKELYAAAPGGDISHNLKRIGPRLAELRLFFTAGAHTQTRVKMWNEEAEDPYAATFQLEGLLGNEHDLTGDIYEGGVLLAKGASPLVTSTAVLGAELVLLQPIPIFPVEEWWYFREKAEEEHGILTTHEPFGELLLHPASGSSFNTLQFKWHVEFKLYFPSKEQAELEEVREEEIAKKEKEREELEEREEEERKKEVKEEGEGKEREEEREEEREKEREKVRAEEEATPVVSVESPISGARVESNRTVGKRVPNPAAEPEEEGEFGEGGEEEGPHNTSPNVSIEFLLEHVAGEWIALWSCLATDQSGYRVRAVSLAEVGAWEFRLEKAVKGAYSLLASVERTGLEEEVVGLELLVAAGVLTVKLGGATIITHEDGAYTEGHLGIEGLGDDFSGILNVTQGGELLDSMKRTENPLAKPKWLPMAWATNTGRCVGFVFGWVPLGAGISGAYWN